MKDKSAELNNFRTGSFRRTKVMLRKIKKSIIFQFQSVQSTPEDTKIGKCSSLLCITALYLHKTHAYLPIYSKSSLNYYNA